METLLSSLLIVLFTSLQLAVVSRLPLQHGMADIVLLFIIAWSLNRQAKRFYIPALIAGIVITFISSVPIPGVLIAYMLAAIMTRVLVNRLWEMPLFSMLIITIIATIAQHLIYIIISQVGGIPIPLSQSLSQITLPSVFLNVILAIPIYLIVQDTQKYIYQEVEHE